MQVYFINLGWQLRWFVLDFGVLSYYKSQDDIQLGCRGSVKMGCCDVTGEQSITPVDLTSCLL